MSELPYMPIYIGEYIADTQHLTAEQHGAYLLLIFSLWRHGGTLPNEPAKLARIATVSLRRWRAISPDVMRLFKIDGGLVRHKRVDHELQKARLLTAKRSASGRLGGRPKSLKVKTAPKANGLHPEPLVSPNGDTPPVAPHKRPTAIDPDWKPSPRCLELLSEEGFGPTEIESARKRMIDWALGANKRKADWDATLRNWARRDADERSTPARGRAPPKRRRNAFDAAMEQSFLARLEGGENEQCDDSDEATPVSH